MILETTCTSAFIRPGGYDRVVLEPLTIPAGMNEAPLIVLDVFPPHEFVKDKPYRVTIELKPDSPL